MNINTKKISGYLGIIALQVNCKSIKLTKKFCLIFRPYQLKKQMGFVARES